MNKWFREPALPDLGNNIKCGNSLVDFDIQEMLKALLPEEREKELSRIKPFNWNIEFSQIFKNGRFDVVIGNPPYVRQESLKEWKTYFINHYRVYHGAADLYTYFIEKGLTLLRVGGVFSFIVANKWTRANYGTSLRKYLKDEITLTKLIDFGELPVFKNASTFPMIMVLEKKKGIKQNFEFAQIKRLNFTSLENEINTVKVTLDDNTLREDAWSFANNSFVSLIDKMKKTGVPFKSYSNEPLYFGLKTALNAAFIINIDTYKKLTSKDSNSKDFLKPYVFGDNVRKYHIRQSSNYVILIPKGWTNKNIIGRNPWILFKEKYPAITDYLEQYKIKAENRSDMGDYWWELRACDYYDKMERIKIIWPDIAKESRFTIDYNSLYFDATCFFIALNDLYLLGVLNSKLSWFYFKQSCAVLGDQNKKGRLRLKKIYLEQLPIRTINFSDPADKARHDKMVALVERMLKMHKDMQEAKTPDTKTQLQRTIDATDKEIDRLVYELYGLTEEEIKVIEDSIK